MTEPGGGRVAFDISPELRARCEELIAAVRDGDDPRQHRDELADVIVDLTDTGLDFYYLYPLERARVGRVARGTAQMGMAAARRTIPPVIRRVLGGLAAEQIRGIVDFLDDILVR